MKTLLATAVLFAFPISAGATPPAPERWNAVTGDATTLMIYIDASSVSRSGKMAHATALSVVYEEIDGRGSVSFTQDDMQFDCNDGLYRIGAKRAYSAKRELLQTVPDSITAPFRVASGNRYMEAALRYVCKGEGGTAVTDPYADAIKMFGVTLE